MNSCRQAIIIEDSKTIQLHLKNLIEPLNYEVHIKNNLSEIHKLLDDKTTVDIALVSLDTDSKDLEKIVNLLIKYNIGIILLSGSEQHSFRDIFLKKDIIDYIEKDSPTNFNDITKILKKLDVNMQKKITRS